MLFFMSKSLILAVEDVKIWDTTMLHKNHKTFGMTVKKGVTEMDSSPLKLSCPRGRSSNVEQRLSLADFSWNLLTWLKDLFAFHTSRSPTRGNVNKPSPEKFHALIISLSFLKVSPGLVLLQTSLSILRV